MYLNDTHERRYWWYLYIAVSVTPLLATFVGLVYLYRRKKFIGLERPFDIGDHVLAVLNLHFGDLNSEKPVGIPDYPSDSGKQLPARHPPEFE
ncbi:hypothetical protein HT576_02595 [Haloterrigena sp. SYSU A121-1]|uniref:Uncharacterized protein n=1 Tax=Haloterrigena gelatinilytica TaxID=2741724 RepID=A0A8J8KA74_9EURY|nr:hypothetical protein [Haloterrigena gelatinilytica]NUB89920.1 hypothetical protein [Haloterrigena gelatinilytica]